MPFPDPKLFPDQQSGKKAAFDPSLFPDQPQPEKEEMGIAAQLMEAASRGSESFDLDLEGYDVATGSKPYEPYAEKRKQFESKSAEQPLTLRKSNLLGRAAIGAAEMIPGMVKGYVAGVPAGATAGTAAAIAGQLGPQALIPEEIITVPTAFAWGMATGSAGEWYKQGTGSFYTAMRKDGVGHGTASIVSQIAAAPYALIELFQVGKVIPGLKQGLLATVKGSAKEIFKQVAKKYGANWAEQVTQEVLQEVIAITGEEVAKGIENYAEEKDLDPTTLKESFGRLWETGVNAGLSFGLIQIPYATVQATTSLAQRETSADNIDGTTEQPEVTEQPEAEPDPVLFPDQPAKAAEETRPELALDFLLFPDQPQQAEAQAAEDVQPQVPQAPESPTIDTAVQAPVIPEAPPTPPTVAKTAADEAVTPTIPEAAPAAEAVETPPPPKTPTETPGGDLTPEFVTGIKHSVVTQEREERGLEELHVDNRKTWGKVWDEAKEKIKSGEIVPRELSKDLSENPRPITDTQGAVLDYEKVSLKNIHNRVKKAIGSAKTEDEAVNLRRTLLEVEESLNTNDLAAKQAGTETARGLAFRRATVKSDYTLASVVQEARNANQGEQIPDDTRIKIERLTTALEDAQKRLKEYDETAARAEGQEAVETIKREARKQKRQVKKADLDAEYEDLIKEFAKTENNLNALVNPQQVALLAKMAVNRVSSGVQTIEQLVDDIYAVAKDHVKGLTKRDVRDAISGYGKYTALTKNEVKLKLQDIREQGRLISAIEDIESGKKPLKSGFERKKQSEEAKELQKKLALLRKKLEAAEKRPDSETDSRLKAYKTRLKNEIERIEKGIPKKPRQSIKLDAEAEALKQKLALLRKKSGYDTDSKLTAYKTRLKNEQAKLEQMIREGNFQKPAPRKKLQLDPQADELKRKVFRLKRQVNHEIALIERKNRPLKQKIGEGFLDIVNIPRSLISSLDLSASLRQGGFLLAGHPREHFRAFKQQLKYMRSEKFIDQLTIEIEESPNSILYDKSGLYLANKEGNKLKISQREEKFQSQIAEKIPVIGAGLRGSERAYGGFLDKLRMDVFNDMAEQYMKAGMTFEKNPEVFKAAAQYINGATGRGDLGLTLNKIAPLLNGVFFSARLIASRLRLLNPIYYASLPEPVRIQAMKDAAKFVGAGMSVLTLAWLAGADVETDRRSSDFGKIKIGNMRLDIWGGFQQFIVFFARLSPEFMGGGKTKSTATGELKSLNGSGPYDQSRASLIEKMTRQKLSPPAAAAWDLLSGKGFMGDDVTLEQQAINLTVPLYMRDLAKATEEMGYEDALLSIPGFFGVGVQYFKPEEKKKRRRTSKTTD